MLLPRAAWILPAPSNVALALWFLGRVCIIDLQEKDYMARFRRGRRVAKNAAEIGVVLVVEVVEKF